MTFVPKYCKLVFDGHERGIVVFEPLQELVEGVGEAIGAEADGTEVDVVRFQEPRNVRGRRSVDPVRLQPRFNLGRRFCPDLLVPAEKSLQCGTAKQFFHNLCCFC